MFLEGPQWIPATGVLVFSESDNTKPASGQPGTINQLTNGTEVSTFHTFATATNGIAIDPQGRIVVAEAGANRVVRIESDGTVAELAAAFDGKRLNAPNDIAVRSDGSIYFTDPIFENVPTELDFHGVFRIAPDGTLSVEHRGALSETPNGIVLSPDETQLFVADTFAQTIWKYDVAPDGTLAAPTRFAMTSGYPDGMTIDAAGNLFVASVEVGVEAFAPDGKRWGEIPLPNPGLGARQPSNCAFGGADRRTLFITANGVLYQVTLANAGVY